MRILVTGGAGYIGSVSVEALVAAGHEVTVLDDLSTGYRGAVSPSARLKVGSYGDTAAVAALLERHHIDAVLHCAAKSIVGESMTDPAKYFRENVAGGVALLEAMRTTGTRRIVFSSTAATYGMPERTPIVETDQFARSAPMARRSAASRAAIRWYGHGYGLRSVILRYFNAAGASPPAARDTTRRRTSSHACLGRQRPGAGVTLFGDDYPTPDGTCVRDYIHVEDLARAHMLALEATNPADARTGRVGAVRAIDLQPGERHRLQQPPGRDRFGSRRRPTDHRQDWPTRPGDPPILVASPQMAHEKLGWKTRNMAPSSRSSDRPGRGNGAHPRGYAK